MLRPRTRRARLQSGSPSPRNDPERHRRLHPHMAKKRVHELAKQYDMPSAEVLKRLGDAGIEVKAAASAVDEDAADRALTGPPHRQEEEAERPPAEPGAPQSPTGPGADAPADGDKPRQRPTRSSL